MVELGISTFGETTPLESTGQIYTHDERLRQLVAEIELADKVGLDVYALESITERTLLSLHRRLCWRLVRSRQRRFA